MTRLKQEIAELEKDKPKPNPGRINQEMGDSIKVKKEEGMNYYLEMVLSLFKNQSKQKVELLGEKSNAEFTTGLALELQLKNYAMISKFASDPSKEAEN